jgi:hypothetical protein
MDLRPSAPSSGTMKRSKTSSTSASTFWISARTASFTMELKTRGRAPSLLAAFTCSIASRAFSTVSMKGSVTRWKSKSPNWERSEEPRPSTVIPVRSEMKNTRWGCGIGQL